MRAKTQSDPRWSAVVARDPSRDGEFVFAVKTTGIYCRPSCPARRANRENVSFFATSQAAEAAGFRACKRCKPKHPRLVDHNASMIAEACRRIEAAEEPPRLDALASDAGASPYHFHRLFKSITGLTPRGYWMARAQAKVRETLATAATVTEALHEAGFSSAKQFYTGATEALGMAPGTYRKGGAGTAIRFAIGACALGPILIAATAKGVCAVLLGDEPEHLLRDLQDRFPKAELIGNDPAFDATAARVIACIDDARKGLDLPLDVQGTLFQQRVWEALRTIPPGKTASYSEIAAKIGAPAAVRAVAGACAANPVAVIIPCHRVVRNDGTLSGYRWGIERKQALLAREGAPPPRTRKKK